VKARKSWAMAYCGMAAALSVALMLLGAVVPVGAHQIVCRSQRLPPGIFQCSIGVLDTIDQIHIVPLGPLVIGHTARLIQQVEHPPDAAADIAHTLALAVLIGGKRGVERAVDVAHRLLLSDSLAGREATCKKVRLPWTLCWRPMMCQTQGIRLVNSTVRFPSKPCLGIGFALCSNLGAS